MARVRSTPVTCRANLATSQTPLADAARLFLGAGGGWLLTVGATLSILGTNGNTVLTGPRYLYALARDGYGPRWLASVERTWRRNCRSPSSTFPLSLISA